MTDIVERLRYAVPLTVKDTREAADEIERLREVLEEAAKVALDFVSEKRTPTHADMRVGIAAAIRALKEPKPSKRRTEMPATQEEYNRKYHEEMQRHGTDRDEAVRRTNIALGYGNSTALQYAVTDEAPPPVAQPKGE